LQEKRSVAASAASRSEPKGQDTPGSQPYDILGELVSEIRHENGSYQKTYLHEHYVETDDDDDDDSAGSAGSPSAKKKRKYFTVTKETGHSL